VEGLPLAKKGGPACIIQPLSSGEKVRSGKHARKKKKGKKGADLHLYQKGGAFRSLIERDGEKKENWAGLKIHPLFLSGGKEGKKRG